MKSKTGAVFLSGLISGTLDILAAIFFYAIVFQKTTAIKILQSIASGVFKKEAYTGGAQMTWYGLGFHFIIAILFAWFYFTIYPYLPFLKKNALLSGIIYGIFVWIVMNLIVLPIVFPLLPEKHFDFPLILSVLILIFCIGFPIAFIARKYYISIR
ncbi:DUF1440 domain-containing protein [Flavobacterium sp. ANB]|uniref:DUF1440 domain-containing protein n=1 Tax=unclassified Flavobacterium TaxID=196869 RepID=UPI0012B80EED|nr:MULTISPECIES: DUF1440 domain-containing protein [unclassified Flavobacterium]MBF4516661.1 DUF1440 domain-containing protein [Flavobacterium sp. ANB]MTD69443.1 DUF1440 domain-containing protein [Flavobacterium sp. LC2016-13]